MHYLLSRGVNECLVTSYIDRSTPTIEISTRGSSVVRNDVQDVLVLKLSLRSRNFVRTQLVRAPDHPLDVTIR